MRLPEIFDFQQFPIAESQKFLMVKNCPKLSRLFSAFDFHENKSKILPKFRNQPENVKNVENYTGIFENRQPLSKIPVHFRHFRHIPVHF